MMLLAPLTGLLARLRRDTRAVALVEFAVTAPVLITLYLGSYVVTDMISANRKVSVAARELTDMATRYRLLPPTTAATVLQAAQQVMTPYSTANATIWISEVQVVDATHVTVVWSQQTVNGGTPQQSGAPRAAGTQLTVQAGVIPPNLVPSGAAAGTYCTHSTNTTGTNWDNSGTNVPAGCLLLGEVQYNYTPVVGGWAVTTLSDSIYMQPRYSAGAPQTT